MCTSWNKVQQKVVPITAKIFAVLSFISVCPDDDERFIEVDGTCHYIDMDVKTIDEAYSACSERSGKLWEPQSLDTMNAVHAQIESMDTETDVGIWVGITDENSEGEWYYKSTSESFPFEVKIYELP